jgi:hypothetical protein
MPRRTGNEETMQQDTRDTARQAAGAEWLDAVAEPAIPVLASPSWRGVDGDLWRLRKPDGATCLAKVMDADTAEFSDCGTAIAAARQASDAGLGPRVLSADPAGRVLVMEELCAEAGWTTGTLDRMADRDTRLAVLAARKAFQRTAPLGRKADVFGQADALLEKCRTAGAPLPQDVAWMATGIHEARDALRASGVDHVPAHGDGNVSNVLISGGGEIRLVDWDMAGDMDPYQDLGSFLAEAHDCESDAVESFEAFHGSYDRALFNRSWLYGIADDFRWGLIGALLAGTSRRETYEFLKFGDWRFLRARMGIRDPRFSEKLGRV